MRRYSTTYFICFPKFSINFPDNSVGTFNPTLNFISKATTILTSDQLKTLALSKSNKEIDVVIPELDKPIWVNGWTRFPSKGN